jgi:hypothetical protein
MSKVRADTVVAVLPDGRVLAAGGRNLNDHYLSSAEIYDPVTNSWSPAPSMGEPRSDAYAAPLPGGKVLVVGGSIFKNIDTGQYPYTSDTAEIYDPAAGNWTRAGDLNVPRGNGADMASLPGGRALILGGYHYTMVDPGPPATWSGGVSEKSAEIYDPSTNAWTLTAPMAFARNGASVVALDDGSVLVAGGINNNAERFADVALPIPTADPVVTPTPTATATPEATPEPTPEATPAAPGGPAPTATPAPAPSTIAFGKLPKRFSVSKTGTFTVTLSCTGTAACGDTVLVRLRAGKHTILARTKVSIRPGRTASIQVRLSKADSRRLARRTTPVTFELTTQKLKVNTTLRG